nr:dockerin type I repeat-containing protein [Oscillospiraceae bacterium]
PYLMTFTYQDIKEAMDDAGSDISQMANFYVSATNDTMKVYAVYAVPKNTIQDTTVATDEDTTNENTVKLGDVDADGNVGVLDIVTLQKYLLKVGTLNAGDAADMNSDNVIDIYDLALLKRAVLAG